MCPCLSVLETELNMQCLVSHGPELNTEFSFPKPLTNIFLVSESLKKGLSRIFQTPLHHSDLDSEDISIEALSNSQTSLSCTEYFSAFVTSKKQYL